MKLSDLVTCAIGIAFLWWMALRYWDLHSYQNENRCKAALTSGNVQLAREYCK